MKDPPRLFDNAADPFERKLLGSAQADGGSAAAKARCVAVASIATVVASQSVASAAVAGSATVGVGVALKAVAVGLVVGLSVQGATALHARYNHYESLAITSRLESKREPKTSSAASVRVGALPADVIPANASAVEPLSPAPVSKKFRLQAPSPKSPQSLGAADLSNADDTAAREAELVVSRPDDSLDREVKLIDDARRSSMAGDDERALLLLDRHRQQFASGALGPEALVIRVRVLTALGRQSEAVALAKPFITANPNSPVAKRLSSALDNSAGVSRPK